MDNLNDDTFPFDDEEAALEALRNKRLRGRDRGAYGDSKGRSGFKNDSIRVEKDYSKPLIDSNRSSESDFLSLEDSLDDEEYLFDDDSLPDFEFDNKPEPSYAVPNFPDAYEDPNDNVVTNYLVDADSSDSDSVDSSNSNTEYNDDFDLYGGPYTDDDLGEDNTSNRDSINDDGNSSSFLEVEENSIPILSNDEDILNSLAGSLNEVLGDLYDDEEAKQNHKDSFENSSFSSVEDPDEDLRGFEIDEVIGLAIDKGASDIHITPGDSVAYTINGSIYRIEQFGVIEPIVTETLHRLIISHQLEANFVRDFMLDASYVVKKGRHKGRRLRLALGKANHSQITLQFRVISDNIPTPAELGITGSLLDWVKLPNGLVMMNGPTGTGKSSTLASLVKEIQRTRREKIITVEKPIEYVFGNDGLGIVVQREVGVDARSFSDALDLMMREAPNIIVVGEVRNNTEVSQLLRAAETGHLVISTMHTNSAAETINRISSLFAGDDQKRILRTLGDISRGFANQVLVPTLDGKSRFAVREVLDIDPEVSEMIATANTKGIKDYQMRNKITMEHMLANAVLEGKCSIDGARSKSSNPFLFDKIIKEYV